MRHLPLMLILTTGCYEGMPEAGETWQGTTATLDSADISDLALCQPDAYVSCYDGPPETLGIGVCQAGRRRCEPDGQDLGPCIDMVLPVPEDCDTPEDDDCDGSNACGDMQQIFAHSGVRLHDVAGGLDTIVIAWSDATGTHLTNLKATGAPEQTVDLGTGLSMEDKILLARDDASGALTLGATLVGKFTPAADRPLDCDEPAGKGDLLLARFTADLTLTTSRCWGDAELQRLTALDVPADGAPRIAGLFRGTLDLGGVPLTSPGQGDSVFFAQLDSGLSGAVWSEGFVAESAPLELPGIAATADGGVAFGTLRNGPESAGGSDVFVTSYRPGDTRWTQRFGNSRDQVSRGVAVAADGAIWIVGESQGFLDLGDEHENDESTLLTFVARLDPATGEPVASLQVPGLASISTQARALTVDSLGDMTLIGAASSALSLGERSLPAGGGQDVVAAKFAPTGAVRWAKRLGDHQDQVARAIALDTDARILVGGEFSGVLADGGVGIHTDTPQLFVLQFRP